MRATLFYRIGGVILLLFAAGHTYGFLNFTPSTPGGVAVQTAMRSVPFDVNGRTYTFGRFYEGFGLYISVFQLFAAVLAWQLGQLARERPGAARSIGWSFFLVQAAGAVLAWRYFGPPQVAFSLLVAAPLGVAAWLDTSPARASD